MGSSANLTGLQSNGSGTPAAGGSGRNSGGAQGLDGAMDRHASLQSLRSYPQGAPDRLLQKIESMASTAVRAAAKIKVPILPPPPPTFNPTGPASTHPPFIHAIASCSKHQLPEREGWANAHGRLAKV